MKKKHIKDPGSAITHFIGMLMAIFAAFPLLIKAAHEPSRIYLISLAIYAVSLIFLYAASTTYHTFDLSERVNTILKKIDHMMIFVLINGKILIILIFIIMFTRNLDDSKKLLCTVCMLRMSRNFSMIVLSIRDSMMLIRYSLTNNY